MDAGMRQPGRCRSLAGYLDLKDGERAPVDGKAALGSVARQMRQQVDADGVVEQGKRAEVGCAWRKCRSSAADRRRLLLVASERRLAGIVVALAHLRGARAGSPSVVDRGYSIRAPTSSVTWCPWRTATRCCRRCFDAER